MFLRRIGLCDGFAGLSRQAHRSDAEYVLSERRAPFQNKVAVQVAFGDFFDEPDCLIPVLDAVESFSSSRRLASARKCSYNTAELIPVDCGPRSMTLVQAEPRRCSPTDFIGAISRTSARNEDASERSLPMMAYWQIEAFDRRRRASNLYCRAGKSLVQALPTAHAVDLRH